MAKILLDIIINENGCVLIQISLKYVPIVYTNRQKSSIGS